MCDFLSRSSDDAFLRDDVKGRIPENGEEEEKDTKEHLLFSLSSGVSLIIAVLSNCYY